MTTLFPISTPTQMRDRSRDQYFTPEWATEEIDARQAELRQRTRQTAIVCVLSESERGAEATRRTGGRGLFFGESMLAYRSAPQRPPERNKHRGGMRSKPVGPSGGAGARAAQCEQSQYTTDFA
ncbi:MAG: hypothetical protein FWD61_09550, partial [Phycisphaerales bacterium]|nr:hypothetical protein [Phycisphaerales bacterium]